MSEIRNTEIIKLLLADYQPDLPDHNLQRLREAGNRVGNSRGLLDWLASKEGARELNKTDRHNLSLLYRVLAAGWGKTQPEVVLSLLCRGALIREGTQPGPAQIPKGLTATANAKNVEYIFKKVAGLCAPVQPESLFLEIGAGDGYLKYLLSRGDSSLLKQFYDKLIESEAAAGIVDANRSRGKYQLTAGFRETLQFFAPGSLAGIVSMNVLDILTAGDLTAALETGYSLLKPGGWYLHIMSSAIHKNVFLNLEAAYRDMLILPYHREGYLGVRLVAGQGSGSAPPAATPAQLADLFARNPQAYLKAADEISHAFAPGGNEENLVLLKDFSLGRIMQAARDRGYGIACCEEITSQCRTTPDDYHKTLAEMNSFTNKLGTLFSDVDEKLEGGGVRECSTFAFLLLQRV